MGQGIYLDNTATTRVRREVIRVVNRYFAGEYGNPSSIHRSGLVARGSIEMARERIARALGCASEEIVFTGSGSEANNLAVKGLVRAMGDRTRIVTSDIEHSSLRETCRSLAAEGSEVLWLPVDGQGRYDLAALEGLAAPGVLIALSCVNNEIGTAQDWERIAAIAKAKGAALHLDAVQALPYFRLDAGRLGADTLAFSGHKLYAPKGVGFLYVRRGTGLVPQVHGGAQEFGLRSGTENTACIVGLSMAVALNDREKEGYVARLAPMRDAIVRGVLGSVPDAVLTGDPERRAPNHASFCFRGINGKMLVKRLSRAGIEASSGAACSSPKNEPSHVLTACGIDPELLSGGLRITLGRYNRPRDVRRLLKVLPRILREMRERPPAYDNAPPFLSQAELREKLAAGAPLQIVDVRYFKYPAASIPGSIHIPMFRLAAGLKRLDRKAETLVVCFQGDVISPEAWELFKKAGFSDVKVLKGGLFGYVGHAPY